MNTVARRLTWLRMFSCLRRKCFICNVTESFGSENVLIGSDGNDGLYCSMCWEEYSDMIEEIRFKLYTTSESESIQDTNDSTDSSD